MNLSIKEMAARTGLTEAAISNLETGKTENPRAESVDALVKALEAEGVTFTAQGVERLQNTVVWLPDYMALLDDIIVRRPEEVLFMNADDSKSSPDVTARVSRIRDAGVKMRFLIPSGIDHITGRPADYRRSELLATRDVTVIYDRRIGFWTPDGVMLIVSDFLAQDYRKQFEAFWTHGEKI